MVPILADMIKTCEFVTPKHPDKICDFVADSILDVFLSADPASRVAVEVMGGHNYITISGEIRSKARIDLVDLVKKIVGDKFNVNVHVVAQSSFIASGVDTGGAGDQGIMVGYATNETENFMPLEYELARNLCQKIYEKYPFDGKVQVTLENNIVQTVVASFQNTKSAELLDLSKRLLKSKEYLVNPAGEWSLGGFDADSGLSGRKIIIDNYGPEHGVGGGSFSGKDYTKVDRSGAYMARRIAVDLLLRRSASQKSELRPEASEKKYSARQVQVKLAYAIGKAQPVMSVAIIDGKEEEIKGYDLTPKGIKDFLKLDQVKFADTSVWGHFGRGYTWDI